MKVARVGLAVGIGALVVALVAAWVAIRRESRDYVPVLTYHYFRSPEHPHPAVPPGLAGYYIVTGREFDEQLDYLRSAGYHPVSFTQLCRARKLADLPPKPIVITVDHEGLDRLQIAVPSLLRHRMTATFFVVTGWIGRPGNVTARDLRAMADSGMDVESHTLTHPTLTEVPREAVAQQLADSRRQLEAMLGRPVLTMSPPGGKWNAITVEEARRAGYLGFRTTDPGWGHVGDYAMPAITLPGSLSRADYARLLSPSGIVTLVLMNRAIRVARSTLGTRYAGLRAALIRHRLDRVLLSPLGRMAVGILGLVVLAGIGAGMWAVRRNR